MRLGRTLLAGILGVLVGAVAMLGLQEAPAGDHARTGPVVPDGTGADTRSFEPVKPAPAPTAPDGVLVAWTPGGLPDGFPQAVATIPRVDAVSVVHGGLLELARSRDADGRIVEEHPAGFVVPLDAIAIDPATYGAFVPKAASGIAGLPPGHAVLGATSAALRGIGIGGQLELANGSTLVVSAIVDDVLVGAAEVAVATPQPAFKPRYLLIRAGGDRAAVEEAIRALVPAGTPLRVRGPGESPYLRHGDAVLPQSIVKEQFGEFAYRPGAGRDVTMVHGWAADHLETAEVPLLGRVTCHRAILPALRGALAELQAAGLAALVESGGYAGCYNPRLTDALDSVSRHAWGIAVDLNTAGNPYGQQGDQDPRLIRVLERWGFTWGGEWLIPDPAHFEFTGRP